MVTKTNPYIEHLAMYSVYVTVTDSLMNKFITVHKVEVL